MFISEEESKLYQPEQFQPLVRSKAYRNLMQFVTVKDIKEKEKEKEAPKECA